MGLDSAQPVRVLFQRYVVTSTSSATILLCGWLRIRVLGLVNGGI